MELFEYIDLIFSDPQKALAQSDTLKRKHSFMINRFCSSKYPLQAASLNMFFCDQVQVVNYWINNLSKIYNKTPKWFYIKTKNVKKEDIAFDRKLIKEWCIYYKLSLKDAETMKKTNPQILKRELKNFKNKMKQYEDEHR